LQAPSPGAAASYNRGMSLTPNQKKYLRGLGHPLQPIVAVGQQGLTDAVVRELDLALDTHELLKVRVRAGDRRLRGEILSSMAERTQAELVHTIGNVGLFYRKNKELAKLLIPDS